MISRAFVMLSLVPSALALLAPVEWAPCKEPEPPAASIAGVAALLAGSFDNAAQIAQDRGRASPQVPPLPHVTVTVEPTQRAGWELWRVHMDVDPEVAREAGARVLTESDRTRGRLAALSTDVSWQSVAHRCTGGGEWVMPRDVTERVACAGALMRRCSVGG